MIDYTAEAHYSTPDHHGRACGKNYATLYSPERSVLRVQPGSLRVPTGMRRWADTSGVVVAGKRGVIMESGENLALSVRRFVEA